MAMAKGASPEVIGPRLEADVGHHGGGPFGTAAIDHLVQEAGRLAGLGPLDPIEPELVNFQEIEVAVVPQPLVEAVIGQRGGQVVQQLGAGGVADAVALGTGGHSHRLHDSALSHAALARDDEVVSAANELPGGQGLDLYAVDGFGIEVPVEAFQRHRFAEAGLANAAFDRPLAAEVGLGAEHVREEFQRAPPLLLRLGQRGIQFVCRQGDSQRLEVSEDALPQIMAGVGRGRGVSGGGSSSGGSSG